MIGMGNFENKFDFTKYYQRTFLDKKREVKHILHTFGKTVWIQDEVKVRNRISIIDFIGILKLHQCGVNQHLS